VCLIKHHARKTCGGVEILFHAFLSYELGGGDCRASFSAVLPPVGIPVGETFGMGSHDVEYWARSRYLISFLNGHFIHPASSTFFQQKGVENDG
jgi:hypothetical protein